MDDKCSGMEMMLSAIASPIEDDLWQLSQNTDDIMKEEVLDSAAQSPTSSLLEDFDDSSSSSLSSPSFQCDSGSSSLSSFDMMLNMFPDPTSSTPAGKCDRPVRKSVVVRRKARECSMVCWLFRTLLTSEYRALPINAIYEIFEESMLSQSNVHGRHYRQSIRHSLMTSAVFVRVLTPNPRKDFLVMNEQGSWWTVHPDCEVACVDQVFRRGNSHRCPPNVAIPSSFSRNRQENTKSTKFTPTSPSSDCSVGSSSSSSTCSSTGSTNHRYDPIRRFNYNNSNQNLTKRTVYKRLSGQPSRQLAPQINQPIELVNPRSILLNDITVDHEEEVI